MPLGAAVAKNSEPAPFRYFGGTSSASPWIAVDAEGQGLVELGPPVSRVSRRFGSSEGRAPRYESRLQKPNSKHQRSPKTQAPKRWLGSAFWNLELGICLEFGVWDLVFRPICPPDLCD